MMIFYFMVSNSADFLLAFLVESHLYIYIFLLSSGSRLLRGSSQCLRGQFLRHAAPHRALHKSHRHLPKATYDGQAAPDS